ncbi:MAG: tRNA (uridine(34)/cytosine(34)/5-carboxymethylaminomethyluridine(34)-2'-O)-methyltransferase TrmL [Eubacteriales bacterium]|nr:tRNA (uridine(34)/cytosine(34)/5-carboxymethylaminomethyluridine(34)-2'-O)-methyltransferase TrmL [Eubacteriales bacterium]
MFNIVLLEPEIPQNTGNIARTCAATGCILHLIEPMGFSIDEKQVKRAGLDYWHLVTVKTYKSIEDFYSKNQGTIYYVSTKSEKTYCDVEYKENDYFIFGKETKGIPEDILMRNREMCIRIPMDGEARSLNLSNSAAIVIYEALRQTDFCNLKKSGDLFN